VSSKRSIDKTVDAAHWVLGPLSDEEKEYWGVGGKGLDHVLNEIARIIEELGEDPTG
jgi:PTH1 family peptidyl-tRNA hydrolase